MMAHLYHRGEIVKTVSPPKMGDKKGPYEMQVVLGDGHIYFNDDALLDEVDKDGNKERGLGSRLCNWIMGWPPQPPDIAMRECKKSCKKYNHDQRLQLPEVFAKAD